MKTPTPIWNVKKSGLFYVGFADEKNQWGSTLLCANQTYAEEFFTIELAQAIATRIDGEVDKSQDFKPVLSLVNRSQT